jgi:hypothetical protein
MLNFAIHLVEGQWERNMKKTGNCLPSSKEEKGCKKYFMKLKVKTEKVIVEYRKQI